MVFVKPVMAKHPRRTDKIGKTRHGYVCDTSDISLIDPRKILRGLIIS